MGFQPIRLDHVAATLVVLVLISRVSYALIERPARARIRALLAPRREPTFTAPHS